MQTKFTQILIEIYVTTQPNMQPLPQEIANILSQTNDLDQITTAITSAPDFPNPWGDVHYASAWKLFETLRILSRYLPEPYIYQVLGFTVDTGRQFSPDVILTELKLDRVQDEVQRTWEDYEDMADPFGSLITRIGAIRK